MAPTTFLDLIRRDGVSKIEIPIIQRDYAQGRADPNTERIRSAFLDVLCRAVLGEKRVHLDFVYGEVRDGTLIPLDGQQRLTALFLLHWYLGARSNDGQTPLPALTYATRYSSRVFCEKLPEQRPFPLALASPRISDWLRDRHWFVRAWRHDPTISSMLVVLDDLHERLGAEDCEAAWQRLTHPENPAITFHFQPISDLGLTDDLYIKMNSRGKPLTDFEGFKAEFEEIVRTTSPSRYHEICTKIDNQWSDVLWRERDDDNAIDDQFMSYFRFVTETAAHLSCGNIFLSGDDLDDARTVFGPDNEHHEDALSLLFSAFDVWTVHPPEKAFSGLLTSFQHESGKAAIFDQETNLFHTACSTRHVPIGKRILLYAVLKHLRDGTSDIASRLRTLRNLVVNTELREDDVPTYLMSAGGILDGGALADVEGFSSSQIEEEQRKATLIEDHPELLDAMLRAEDHWLLRGSLAALGLDATAFEHRAKVFMELFSPPDGTPVKGLRAALLACGDYSFQNQSGKFQFGTHRRDLWRQLLARKRCRKVLRTLLDSVPVDVDVPITERLQAVVDRFLAEREATKLLDWRYYLVKYPSMHSGESGLYVGAHGAMGFELCMLDKTTLNSWYRDPYLHAVAQLTGVDVPSEVSGVWYKGNDYFGRWLRVESNGAKMRSVPEGWRVAAPEEDGFDDGFEAFREEFGVNDQHLVAIPQAKHQGSQHDAQDRIVLGSRILRALVDLPPD